MVTFYGFPQELEVHIRTVNVVESPSAALRLRTDAAKRFRRCDRATTVIWRCSWWWNADSAALLALHPLANVYAGMRYVDAVEAAWKAAT
jgi:putative transposase